MTNRLNTLALEASEATVYATISCENPECESRGQEPHKMHDGDPMDYCQVCCEETLTLRLHTPPPVEEGERGVYVEVSPDADRETILRAADLLRRRADDGGLSVRLDDAPDARQGEGDKQ